jgi:hypothetical protein
VRCASSRGGARPATLATEQCERRRRESKGSIGWLRDPGGRHLAGCGRTVQRLGAPWLMEVAPRMKDSAFLNLSPRPGGDKSAGAGCGDFFRSLIDHCALFISRLLSRSAATAGAPEAVPSCWNRKEWWGVRTLDDAKIRIFNAHDRRATRTTRGSGTLEGYGICPRIRNLSKDTEFVHLLVVSKCYKFSPPAHCRICPPTRRPIRTLITTPICHFGIVAKSIHLLKLETREFERPRQKPRCPPSRTEGST